MLIARRIPARHGRSPGSWLQVWRVEARGHGIEVTQYLEQIEYIGSAENALAGAGYLPSGQWMPEPSTDGASVERLPLTADARGFLMRMFRLYGQPGAGHAADPDAAAIAQDAIARLLLFDTPPDTGGPNPPSHYHAGLHEHLAKQRAKAERPARPGHTDPKVCARAADILARIIRTLETEYAPEL